MNYLVLFLFDQSLQYTHVVNQILIDLILSFRIPDANVCESITFTCDSIGDTNCTSTHLKVQAYIDSENTVVESKEDNNTFDKCFGAECMPETTTNTPVVEEKGRKIIFIYFHQVFLI